VQVLNESVLDDLVQIPALVNAALAHAHAGYPYMQLLEMKGIQGSCRPSFTKSFPPSRNRSYTFRPSCLDIGHRGAAELSPS
jgi:hypothetical protein